MEALLAVGAGLAAAASVVLGLPGNALPAGLSRAAGWARGLGPRALAALIAVGRTPWALALLGVGFWRFSSVGLRRRLDERGIVLSDGACAALLALVVGTFGLLVGALFGSPVSGLAAMAAAVALLAVREGRARAVRRRELTRDMPAVFRTLSVAMGSGQTLAQAVEYVGSRQTGPAAEAFSRLSLRLRCGMPAEEALDQLSDELDAPGVDLLATALVISHRTGSPLRNLLVRSARLVERQGEFRRLLVVKTAQVRLSVRIVCALPAVMLLLLALISPDFQAGLLTPFGMLSVLVAAAMDGLALLIIRRLMRGVL